MKTLEELFEIAQQYGNINLFQSEKERTFRATITFMTIEHTQLVAKSGYNHSNIREALISSITKAEEIVASLTATTTKLYKLLN